ncbi:pilus assembly protein PilX [Geomonas sp. Red421]|uniref:Pilus assembly protein PilX n=2 Tax=Geomonas anaerohicana TaxID=2798583 RepID=A0ABS0Y9Q0_9BACT|nr:pilus assembly protein PilX [Geomonas anaerohicana]
MLALISLVIALAVLYLLLTQTKVSGAHKRYKNSLEASHGGVQLITKELIPRMFGTPTPGSSLKLEFSSLNLDLSSDLCLGQKLSLPSSGWAACLPGSKSNDPKQAPDMTFKLPGASGPGYKVYAKIVDTQPGNSDTSGVELLDSATGVTGASPGVSPKHVPALYRLETEGESISNAREKAALTVLYSY